MNHFNLSLIKSIIRILGGMISIVPLLYDSLNLSIILLGSSLALAEILGILEEIFDKRKEK